ncbi:hypothetical protein CC80DRAFT_504870 [Byssothecium circinans]|uniref:Major facilitator superfamily (MFS) profile domain-containing protein n=1 Tax=Byssothecium circinans TaxID=147558 RepID=A0A6A5TX53_9PLEO|nr:hypothetical protein CC80DRAFT_504870 [Byssothecium circinans]
MTNVQPSEGIAKEEKVGSTGNGFAMSEKSSKSYEEGIAAQLSDEQADSQVARGGEEQEQEQLSEKVEDVPPNGGYGWVCVACIAIINGHTWGLNSSYAIFLAYYLANNYYPGATPLQFAFVGGLSISQALMVSPVATLTTRLYGTRTTLLIGVFFETLSFIAASFATKIWHLFLTQGICFGWGMGFQFVGSVVVVPQWFTTRRSLANGFSAAGSGVGGLMYSLAAQSMIKNMSLPWAFRILGILACVVNTSCSLLVKDRNKQIGSSQLSFDYRLFRKPQFIGLLTYGFLSLLGYVVLLFSLPNYARTVGMDATQGSIIGAMFNLGQVLGRPPIGYFSDTIGRLNMAASMTALCGIFVLVIWMFAKSFGVLIFFAIVGGCTAGTFWAVVGPVTTEVIGLVDLPAALSITWLVLVLPTTFSEAIGLELVSYNHGNYTIAIIFTGFMYLGGAAVLWLVRAWKIGELEAEVHVKKRRADEASTSLKDNAYDIFLVSYGFLIPAPEHVARDTRLRGLRGDGSVMMVGGFTATSCQMVPANRCRTTSTSVSQCFLSGTEKLTSRHLDSEHLMRLRIMRPCINERCNARQRHRPRYCPYACTRPCMPYTEGHFLPRLIDPLSSSRRVFAVESARLFTRQRVSLPPPSSPPSARQTTVEAASPRDVPSPARTLWSTPSPTQTLGYSSPELPSLPSYGALGSLPRTPSTVARQGRADSSYYTASWGSPYRNPPPSFNRQRETSTQFGSDDFEEDSSNLQFGLEHLLPPTLVEADSPNRFNLEHLIPRLESNASPNQFNLDHLIPSRLLTNLETPTRFQDTPGATPRASEFSLPNPSEAWVRQFLDRRWNREANDWLSDSTGDGERGSNAIVEQDNSDPFSRKTHKSRTSNRTLNQQDFWSHFSQGQKEQLGKMMASRYAPSDAHSRQGSGGSMRSTLGRSIHTEKPPPSPKETPLPESPNPAVETPNKSFLAPPVPQTVTPRMRKKVMVKGKGCVISIPRDIPRGAPGFPPKPMSPKALEDKIQKLESLGYDTRGFGAWRAADGASGMLLPQNRGIWPDEEYVKSDRAVGLKVRVPNKADWDNYVNHMLEAKLAALGVGVPEEEKSPSPLSRQASVVQHPGQLFSPPLPTPSVGSHRGRQGSIVSGSFPLGPSPGHMSRQSIASPGAFGGMNPRANMHMHRHSTFSPASFMQQTASPTGGAFSPAGYFGAHSARGGSPALSLSRPDLSGAVSPGSPFGMRPNSQFPLAPVQKDDLLAQMQQQQQQLQAQLLQQQQQQVLGIRPSSTLAEVPEDEDEEDEVPLMKNANPTRPDIVVPTPRNHRHNLSANLEREARDAEYHLEEAIDKQFNEGGDFSTEPETEQLKPSRPVTDAKWENTRPMLHQPQPHSRAHSLAKPSQQPMPFAFGAQPENLRGESDGAGSRTSDRTNPSLEEGEIQEDGTENSSAHHSKAPSQISNSWKDSKFVYGKSAGSAMHSKHTSRSSVSKLNVEAKEFKFNPSASFSPGSSYSGFSSFTPALKSPADGITLSNRTSVDGFGSLNVSAPAFKPDAPVFKPEAPAFVFKPAVGTPAFKPAVPAFKPAIEAHAFKPAAQAPEFKPSGMTGSMPSSGFSFNAPSFKPDAPAFKPATSEFTPSAEPIKSFSSSIFGKVDISASDIVKPAKRSKAIPIVRPDATRQQTPEKEDEAPEDAEGRPMQAEGREKRARRGRGDGDDVPKFALHPILPSQPTVEPKSLSSPVQTEKEATLEDKENLSPGGSRIASKSKSPEPLSVARASTPPVEESTEAQTPIDDLSVQESDVTPTVEEPPKKKPSHKSSLSATAKPFEFRPQFDTAGYDFGIHVTKPSVVQTEDEETHSAVPRHISRSPATTFRPSDDGSYKTALESRRHVPYPESESVDFDHLGEASFNDIDAVMKHMNEEGSDFGVERDENSWEHSSPRRTPLEFNHPHLRPNANLRSDAPSPSPRRLHMPRNMHASPTSVTQDPFDDERAGAAYESPVHRLNNADDVPMSDWDEGLVSDGQDKIQTRSRFFDTHVDDIIGRLLHNRLDPLEKNLQGIQDAIATMSQRRGRRSMSATGRLDSDADDEDDEWGTDSHYRNRSPGKNRKLEKIRAIVKEALEAHQPPVTSLPVPVPEPMLPEKIRDMVVEALAAHHSQAPSEQLQAANVREVIMEALAHHQPQWTPPKFDPVPADEIRAIVENAIVAHQPASVEPVAEAIKPEDIRSFVMEAFATHVPPPMPAPVPEQIWPDDIKAIIEEALASRKHEPAVEPLQPEAIRSIVSEALASHQPPAPAVEPLQPDQIRAIVTDALAAHEPTAPTAPAAEPVQPDMIRSIVAEALASHQPVPALATALEAPVDIPQPQVDMSELYQVIGSLKASIAQTTSHHLQAEDVRELIDDAFKRQQAETAKREESEAILERDARIADLEALLKETNMRFDEEGEARKEIEAREANSARLLEVTEKELTLLREQASDDENKIRALQEECEVSRRSIDSFHAGDEEVRAKLTTLFAENEELKLKVATYDAAELEAKRKLEAVTAENEALTYTLEEHRLSANKWRTDLQHAHEESDKLRMAIEQSRLQTEEATRVREGMRAKFEKLQQDMVVASGQAAAERTQWQKNDEAHMKKYEVLSARIEAEGRTRERLERELERLEGQEREGMKLRVALEQTQKHNHRLEETIDEIRHESMEHKRAAERYEREFRDAREAAHVEIRRMRVLMEGDIDKANNEVNIVRHELENEVSRVRAELDNVRMDADTAKEKHELDLEAAADAKKAAVEEALEGKRFALMEQQQAMERRLEIINKENARVLEIAREDKERAEAFHKERLSLADSKMENLHDKVALLEEKLAVAKEAAGAAAAAAQNVKSPAGPSSYGSGAFDKISPQALRESISVLQEQLQERESRIESLEHQLEEADTDAPAKLKERDTEIGWLRELLGVRIDDLNDLINALAQPAFNREAVRDAAIRIRTNLQMEQSEKERLMSGDQKAFPTLATLSNFASPKAVQIAAAFGNWRSKGRDNASSALAGNPTSTTTSRTQTPSRAGAPSAQSFLSGLMTPPTSNLRRTPDLPSSGLRPTALLRSNSSSSRGSVQGFPSLGKQHAVSVNVPSTPPLMRKSSYDADAAEERFSESGFYDDESTVDGEVTPIGLNFGHELRR